MSNKLPITEELDFACLLELMRPLHDIDGFAWLPELFSILGHEKLIDLCKYAGGETITIPTLEQLSDSIEYLQSFYDVYIGKKYTYKEIPVFQREYVDKIRKVYDVSSS